MKIREDGFNGTVGIIWGGDVPMTNVKSAAGVRCVDTLHRSGSTVVEETSTAGRSKGKRCFIGLMTREQSECHGCEAEAWVRITRNGTT